MSNIQRKNSSCYCINLRWAASAITARYDKVLEPAGISITQFSMLTSIDRLNGCTTTDLAIHVGLERTTVVRTLKPLFQKGLIVDTSEKGRRNSNIILTEEGQKVLKEARPLWQKAQEDVENCLGKENAKMFYEMADKLLDSSS